MKSIILIPIGILSALSLFACTEDSEQVVNGTKNAKTMLKSSAAVVVANKDNPYDGIGITYRDLLNAYKAGNFTPSSYSELITTVNTLTNTQDLPHNDLPTQELLANCIDNPVVALTTVLQNSSLSQAGQNIVSNFVNSFQKLAAEPFSEAYDEIVQLENTTISSTALSADDRRVILTVAAVTRYCLYHSCCEDTDWGKSVGNIVAAAAGAIENNNRAIQYALVTSIAGLENIPISH